MIGQNPFMNQYNQGYQAQQYNPYNPIIPYQEQLAKMQMQAQYNQSQQQQAQPMTMGITGEVVDSIDVVKAKNVDLSGNVTFYPKSDLSEIYTKQLQRDGTSKIVTYKAVQPEESESVDTKSYVDIQTLNAMLGQMKAEILQGIGGGLSEIKQMIAPPEQTKRQRGGNQNND